MCQYDRIYDTISKAKSKGESAYLIKFARTRARVRIIKKKFGEYPKERRKNNKNYCRTGERVAKFSVRQNSCFEVFR